MILAEPRGVVAVLPQDLADGDGVALDDAVVAGIARRLVDDDAGGHRMVVAAGEQRGPRRRAERRGVEAGVAQTHFGDAVQRRRRDHAAEGATAREKPTSSVMISRMFGAPFGGTMRAGQYGFDCSGVGVDLASERLRRVRQISAVDGASSRRASPACR